MKKLLLFLCLLTPSAALSMQEDPTDARELLLVSYMRNIYARFQPATRDFIKSNPEAPETKILDRYVDEVTLTAFNSRKKDLPLNQIGQEYWRALDHTPADQSRLAWILTGVKDDGGMVPAASCAHEWRVKQKEIEDAIAKK